MTHTCLDTFEQFYTEHFVALDGTRPLLLDTVRTELMNAMESSKYVIGRYPRRYGKTTMLAGYALFSALHGLKVLCISPNYKMSLDFQRIAAFAVRHLPITVNARESMQSLRIGDGEVTSDSSPYALIGRQFDLVLIDEPKISKTPKDVHEQLDFLCNAQQRDSRIVIAGTFRPSDPAYGEIWQAGQTSQTEWTSLPSKEERQRLDTILSLSHHMYKESYV